MAEVGSEWHGLAFMKNLLKHCTLNIIDYLDINFKFYTITLSLS